MPAPPAADSPQRTVSNEHLRLTLDDAGRLIDLVDLTTGHNYAAGGLIWKLFLEQGQYFQNEVSCLDQRAELGGDDSSITLTYDAVQTPRGQEPIGVSIVAALVGDEVQWKLSLDNRSDAALIKEAHFPLLSDCQLPDDQQLITTAYGGCRHESPQQFVMDKYPQNNQSWYCNNDALGLQVQHLYPGSDASMNCFTFAGPTAGLYVASHDPTFRNTAHLWRMRGEAYDAGMVKHLFLNPGESLDIDGYVTSPYQGTWHTAAEKYQTWTKTWCKPLPRPKHLQNFRGWQRLIFKHQNGEYFFKYDDMPRIFEDGDKAGVNTLFLFGWWPGGFDRMYPTYLPDEEMGGKASMLENIRRFQDEKNGNVFLYFSGRTVDRQSEFYKKHGKALSIKRRSGVEANDSYLFSNQATLERFYGAVELVPMCLETEGWQKELRRMVDLAVEYGCRGVFFDQLGLQEYPCCDPDHGHDTPSVGQFAGKRKAIAALRDYIRQQDPEMSFGVEIFCDAVSEYVDYVQGLFHQRNVATNQDYRETGEKPRFAGFIDWHKFIFPDLLITDRDIRDETDFERRVNFALLRGLANDIEVHRCRQTVAYTPNYQAYLNQTNGLRAKHAELLIHGRYRDTLGFEIDSDQIDARAFVRDGRMAILLTQSHLESAQTTLDVPGYSFAQADGVGDYRVEDDGRSITLGRHGVALVLLTQDGDA